MPVRPLLAATLLAVITSCTLGTARAERDAGVPELPTPPARGFFGTAGGGAPSERMVVDASCFDGGNEEQIHYGYGRAGAAAPAKSGAVTRSTAPMPAPPAATPAGAPMGGVADEAASMPMSAGVAEAEAGAPVPMVPPSEPEPWSPPFPTTVPPVPGPRVDWGGVVHLSNDDSASLASAQRLLWALDHGHGFTTSQIRPHELLNYFSFDTTAPAAGQTFGVHASAEQVDGDTLKLALAVQGAAPPRADLDLTLLIDRSGSMSGDARMETVRRALHRMQAQLHAGDRVDVVLFDDRVCTAVRDFVVGRDNPAELTRVFDRIQPRGSTDLDLGLREAYRVATSHPSLADRAGRVIVFTDAILNTGDINPATVTEVGRHLDARNLRLTGVGVGSDFRDDVLDQLTEKGKGAYVFLGSDRVVDRLFGTGFDALVQTVAEDVRFALDLPDSLGMERFYGEEMSRDPSLVQPVNFQAGNRQVFLEDLAIRPGALRPSDPIRFTASWTDPANGQRREQTFSTTVGQAMAADPHNVRKAAALMAWSDVLLAQAMGGNACGAPLDAYRRTLPGLHDDAEIAYTTDLLARWCGTVEPITTTWRPEPLPASTRLRLDSDVVLSEVEVWCAGRHASYALTTADRVVPLDVPPGRCEVVLHGAVPMRSSVDVPVNGGELRCVIRGGRATCG